MEIRKVSIQQLDEVMNIINDAKRLLSKDSLQWQQGYPNEEVMSNDINNGDLYGAYIDNKLVGVLAYVIGTNPYYIRVYEGKWTIDANEKDLVLHRIAVKEGYHHLHIGDALIKYADVIAKENGCVSIKSDTHVKNQIVQHLLMSNGYVYKGIIILGRDEIDNSRLAYEKVL